MGVANDVEPEHARALLIVEEASPTVDQAAHDLDAGDRFGAVGFHVRGGGGQRPGDSQERVIVDQQASQLAVVCSDREGDREGAVVTREHAVAEIAEVAADGSDLWWELGPVEEAEEP